MNGNIDCVAEAAQTLMKEKGAFGRSFDVAAKGPQSESDVDGSLVAREGYWPPEVPPE